MAKIKLKSKLNKSANSNWEIVDDLPKAQDGKVLKLQPKDLFKNEPIDPNKTFFQKYLQDYPNRPATDTFFRNDPLTPPVDNIKYPDKGLFDFQRPKEWYDDQKNNPLYNLLKPYRGTSRNPGENKRIEDLQKARDNTYYRIDDNGGRPLNPQAPIHEPSYQYIQDNIFPASYPVEQKIVLQSGGFISQQGYSDRLPKFQNAGVVKTPPKFKNIVEKQNYWNTLPEKYGEGVKGRQNYMDLFSKIIPADTANIQTTYYRPGDPRMESIMADPAKVTEYTAKKEVIRPETSWKDILSKRKDINNPALLYSSLMDEGADKFTTKPYTEKGMYSGYRTFGLDNFGADAPNLVKSGYLQQDVVDRSKPTFQFNDAKNPQPTLSSNFQTLDDVVSAKNAYFKQANANVTNYAKKQNIVLSPEAMDYFTVASYNSGQGTTQKMIDDYNKSGSLKNNAFLAPGYKSNYSDVHRNVTRRLASAKMMQGEGFFKQDGGSVSQQGYRDDSGVKVGKSKIQGKGLLANKKFGVNDIIGLSHMDDQPVGNIGNYHNHSDNPNTRSVKIGNQRFLIPIRPLKKGEEITTDYRQQPELEQPEDFNKVKKIPLAQNGNSINNKSLINLKLNRKDEGQPQISGYNWNDKRGGVNGFGFNFNPSENASFNAGLITVPIGVPGKEFIHLPNFGFNYDVNKNINLGMQVSPMESAPLKAKLKLKFQKGGLIKAQNGGKLKKFQNAGQVNIPTTQDSTLVYEKSKALQDYYKSHGYEVGDASYPVPNNYMEVANKAMKELPVRYNDPHHGFNSSDNWFSSDDHNAIPWLLDAIGAAYPQGSDGNPIEKLAISIDGESDKWQWGKKAYENKWNQMMNKLKPIGDNQPLLDMYNSGYMDADAPAQYLNPRIKPHYTMSATKSGNYDEIFMYDPAKIKPTYLLTPQEQAERNKNNPTPQMSYTSTLTNIPKTVKIQPKVVTKQPIVDQQPQTKKPLNQYYKPDGTVVTDSATIAKLKTLQGTKTGMVYDKNKYELKKEHGGSVGEWEILEDGGLIKAQNGVRAPMEGTQEQYDRWKDSSDLDLYTNLQHQLEPSWSVIQGNALQNLGIGQDSEFAKNQHILFNTADSLIRNNPRLEWGSYGDPFADSKGQNSLREQYSSRGGNSPDIRSRGNVIKPANFWTGSAANHDYIQPVQPRIPQPNLQQIAQNPNPSTVTPSTTQTYKSLQPIRPKLQPIDVNPDYNKSLTPTLQKYPVSNEKLSMSKPDWFTTDDNQQERDAQGKKGIRYWDKTTGKQLKENGGLIKAQNGRLFTNPSQQGYTPSSSDNKPILDIKQKQFINDRGTQNNPITLKPVEIVAKRQLDPAKKAFGTVYPDKTGSSVDLAAAMFAAPVGEAFHTPSRLINQGIRVTQGKGLGDYTSEISETLGLQNNDPTDLWAGARNFAVDNAADFIVPTNIPARTVNSLERGAFKAGKYVESANKTKNILQGYREQLNPQFINPQEQEMLHTVRNIGMSMKGEDDIWKASTISNVLDRAKSLSDEQFKTLTGFEKSELSQRLEGLNNGTLKKPEEQLVDGLTREEYIRQHLIGVRNRRPRTEQSRQELQNLSHRLEDPPAEVNIPTDRQSFYSNNRGAFQQQNPQGWQTINTGGDYGINRFAESYNTNQLLGTRFDNFLYKNEPNIIDKFNNKLSKYLSNKQGFMEKAENSRDIQQLVPGLYASQGEKEVKRKLFGAIKTLENAPKGSQFIPAHSLSSDSYPLSYRILPRFLEQGKVDLSFHGMQDFNTLGFSDKVGILPEVNVKEINSVIRDLNQKLNKKIPYARVVNGQIKAPIVSATRKKFGGKVSQWEIMEKGGEISKWEIIN